MATSKTPPPPADLKPAAQARWKVVYPRVAARGAVDLEELKNYCQLWARWREAEDGIDKAGQLSRVGQRVVRSPLVDLSKQTYATVRSLEERLGIHAGVDKDGGRKKAAAAVKSESTRLLVSRPTLARVLGCSVRHIGHLEADRIVEPTLRGKAGKASLYDLERVVPAVLSHERRQLTGEKLSLDQERAQLARAQRIKTETENRKRDGELLERVAVVLDGQNLMKALVAQLRALPRRAVQEGKIPSECESGLAAFVREFMLTITSWKSAEQLQRAAQEAPAA